MVKEMAESVDSVCPYCKVGTITSHQGEGIHYCYQCRQHFIYSTENYKKSLSEKGIKS